MGLRLGWLSQLGPRRAEQCGPAARSVFMLSVCIILLGGRRGEAGWPPAAGLPLDPRLGRPIYRRLSRSRPTVPGKPLAETFAAPGRAGNVAFSMRTPLSALAAFALLCLLQVQAEMPVQADFQQEQFTGTWHSIGLASNSRWFKEKRPVLKMCTTVVTPTEDGNLDVASTYPKLDQCETKRSLFFRTDEPGRFTYTSPWSGSAHDIRVLETNYDEYALLGDTITRGGETFTMVTLYGRIKVLRPELLEKFTQTASGQGLAQEDILILPRTDLCMAETV